MGHESKQWSSNNRKHICFVLFTISVRFGMGNMLFVIRRGARC